MSLFDEGIALALFAGIMLWIYMKVRKQNLGEVIEDIKELFGNHPKPFGK